MQSSREDFQILANLTSKQRILDFGTLQSLLNRVLAAHFDKAVLLHMDILDYLKSTKQYLESAEQPEEASTQTCVLAILALDSFMFNVYAKLKNSESGRVGQSLYASTLSISLPSPGRSQYNIDGNAFSSDLPAFLEFFQQFISSSEIFECILKLLHLHDDFTCISEISCAVKTLVETLDYIIRKENMSKEKYTPNKVKFMTFFEMTASDQSIKAFVPKTKQVLFQGSLKKILALISQKEHGQIVQISMLRLLFDSNADKTSKSPQTASRRGSELLTHLFSYSLRDSEYTKDMLFRANRSSDPVFDFMMNYLTYKFLPVAKTFWQLFDRHVLAHAKSPAKDFFEAFSSNKGANALLNYLDDLPEDLKEFFRDIQGEIVSAKFADKVDSNVPIRTLFVLRFLSPDIRTLVTLENSTDDNMAILKGLNFIKDLFYESSASKYEGIPTFKGLSKDVISKFQNICQTRSPSIRKGATDSSKYFIMKPILNYDYKVLKEAIEELELRGLEDGEAASEDEEDILQENFETTKQQAPQKEQARSQPQLPPKQQSEQAQSTRSQPLIAKENKLPTNTNIEAKLYAEKEKGRSDILLSAKPSLDDLGQDGFRLTFQKNSDSKQTMSHILDDRTSGVNVRPSTEHQRQKYEKEIQELQDNNERLHQLLEQDREFIVADIEAAHKAEKLKLIKQIELLQGRVTHLSDSIPVFQTVYGQKGTSEAKDSYYQDEFEKNPDLDTVDTSAEFYQLSQELDDAYQEVLAAEREYVLYKKFNFPAEFR